MLVNRKGYTVPDAIAAQSAAVVSYNPEIDEIMQTLIQECRDLVEVYVPHLDMKIHPKGLLALCKLNSVGIVVLGGKG